MPELNPDLPGIYCAGNAGDGGVVSSNGQRIVLGPSAGNAHWLNAREIACQYYTGLIAPNLVAVDVFSGAVRTLWLDGVNKIVAGANHWFAVTMRTGVILDGLPVDYNVRAFAGNFMAWFPWNGTGLFIRNLSTSQDVPLSTTLGPEDPIQLFPDGAVVWVEGGQVHSYGIPDFPQAVTVPGGFGWLKAVKIAGVWWLAYQSFDLASVVFHPATELVGYAWPAWNAYRLDVCLLDRPRLVWSRGNADSPADIQVEDVDLSKPRVSLTTPVPPPPEPPKPMDGITENQFAALQTLRAKYPSTLTPEQGGALINEFAWMFRGELGMQRKDAGTAAVQPRTGIHIWNGIRIVRNGQHLGQDVFGGASVGKYEPTRGDVGPADPATFVVAVEPEDAPPPPPNPDTNLSEVLSKLTALTARVSALEAKDLSGQLAEIVTRVTALEQKPSPTLPKGRVKGKTATTLYHNHSIDLEVTWD